MMALACFEHDDLPDCSMLSCTVGRYETTEADFVEIFMKIRKFY